MYYILGLKQAQLSESFERPENENWLRIHIRNQRKAPRPTAFFDSFDNLPPCFDPQPVTIGAKVNGAMLVGSKDDQAPFGISL